MSWEVRRKRKYYYRVGRDRTGRLVKTYFGSGAAAKRAAREDAQEKVRRECEQAERQEWEAMDSHIAQLHQLTKLLSHSHLVNAGFYRHHRGEWRRRG